MPKTGDVLRLMENVIFLKKYTLFAGLNTEDLRSLAVIADEIEVPDKAFAVKEGDAGDSMFIIKRGELKIIKGSGDAAVELAVIPKNSYFGEMVLFEEGQLRSASAVASGPCTLLIFQRDELIQAMREHPSIAFEFIKMFGQRLAKTNDQLREANKRLLNLTREKAS